MRDSQAGFIFRGRPRMSDGHDFVRDFGPKAPHNQPNLEVHMIGRVLRFVRLPLLLLLIFAIARFLLGANGVPYAPRGNAMFSIVGLTFVSSFYFGALSRRLGGFGWGGTALVGYSLGLFAQVLIFVATWLSFAVGIEASYFRHWDALNVPEGTVVPMATALQARLGGLVVGPILAIVPALVGRVLSALAPDPGTPTR